MPQRLKIRGRAIHLIPLGQMTSKFGHKVLLMTFDSQSSRPFVIWSDLGSLPLHALLQFIVINTIKYPLGDPWGFLKNMGYLSLSHTIKFIDLIRPLKRDDATLLNSTILLASVDSFFFISQLPIGISAVSLVFIGQLPMGISEVSLVFIGYLLLGISVVSLVFIGYLLLGISIGRSRKMLV